MTPLLTNLWQVLESAGRTFPENGISIYQTGKIDTKPTCITYSQLFQQSQVLGHVMKNVPANSGQEVVLLHLDTHEDNIRWLWAVIAAGRIPAVSTPFTADVNQRKKHIAHLQNVLQNPIILTKRSLVPEFLEMQGLNIHTIEDLAETCSDRVCNDGQKKSPQDVAVLMLTSGSTGNAKAVTLRHGQVITAIRGKSAYHHTATDDVFLNWIGMDHVANLTEIHLHAMRLGADQVHVPAGDLIANPFAFVRLIGKHSVAYSFAPNFFLAGLVKTLDSLQKAKNADLPNLSCLRALISGGEANSTATCLALTRHLQDLGAPIYFIRPGFGMTETCAGSIYGLECPVSDIRYERDFSSLGHCIPGIEMRVTTPEGVCGVNEIGTLEVKGPVIFQEYYNNPEATISSFTPDGWFITGDLAYLDDGRHLNMVGRGKETIIINGVKYYPHEIEGAIEDAVIPGVTPSFTAIFPYRVAGAASETLCVVYLPSYGPNEVEARVVARDMIRNIVMKHCMARPYRIMPLDKALLQKSALGKLSRAKIRKAFEAGLYDQCIDLDEALISEYQGGKIEQPTNDIEKSIQMAYASTFERSPSELGIHSNLFDMGCNSMELFNLKWKLQADPALPKVIPVTTIIGNPTIASLAAVLDSKSLNKKTYDPVVTLRSGGSKAPLWLIHPGVGEVLVFLHLANHFTDRPIYALRARGFDGEDFFKSIEEMTQTYFSAIKRVQPEGPYALAGYSYGGTVAFEISKKMMANGDENPFLCVFDQPPHIKERMRHGGWVDVLLTLSRFFNLMPDQETEDNVAQELRDMGLGDNVSKDELVNKLLASASSQRLEEFGLDQQRLAIWTSLAMNSHIIAKDYEPSGRVPSLEVLYGQPIAAVAADKKTWLESKLSKWHDFVDEVNFHEVKGHHYTLLSPEFVGSFHKTLSSRLEARGV